MREKVKLTGRWSSAQRRAGRSSSPAPLKRELERHFTHPASRFALHLSLLAFCVSAGAVEVDLAKLPPPATNQVEFARDIKPLFERSCHRCHGPERPKSRFSLTTRDAALKGGDHGVAIIPGNSANSPLIHNIAGLVEDLQMPPEGKTEPLTPTEVSLLRAWIDQGAEWETVPPGASLSLSVSPTVGWTTVRGDERKFREHYWLKEGWNGGAENFLLTEAIGKGSRVTVEGRALLDDSRVLLTLEKPEVGFTRFGWAQYRKYYDDSGAYFPNFTPSVFSLDRDLHLDIGRTGADFGLTFPDWPRLVFGYEYQYREGEKSTLGWGGVNQGGEARTIYPAAKAIDEQVHILKFDLDHEIAGVRIEDSFRGEFYNLRTSRQGIRLNESFIVSSNAASGLDEVREQNQYFQGANTFRLEKSFSDWFFGSAGYLYSKLSADATFDLNTVYPLGPAARFQRNQGDHWRSETDLLDRETHAFNLTSLLGPWRGFTLTAGVLNEWTREKALGRLMQDSTNRFGVLPDSGKHSATFDGDLDKALWEESLALRYTTIPFTVLFAEARLQQESIGQFQEQNDVGGSQEFLRQTDTSSDLRDFRAGFSTSPWRRVSWSADFRHYQKESKYDPLRDESDHGPGYPSFIRWRDVDTDEVQTKLAGRPANWLRTTFTYKYVTTEYQNATDAQPAISPGGRLDAAEYAAHVYSLNATLTPWRRLYLSGTFSYEHSRLAAFANDNPSIVPYRGDRFSVLASGNYALNPDTDLQAGYAFSCADYGQNNYDDGLPLGVNYSQHSLTAGVARRYGKQIALKLQYGFYYYDDPGSGGANNYIAHAIFTTLTMRLP